MGIVAVAFGTTAVAYVGVEEGVEDGRISCGVDTEPAAGAQPDRMINTSESRPRRRFMVCK